MHIGIFLAILEVLIVLISPQIAPVSLIAFGIVPGISIICAIILFLKRIFSVTMRSMSSPDDYISILLVIDFMVAAMAHEIGYLGSGAFLIHATVLFFYFPLGKLKHALFFFIARADYGARLGYRGVYPVKSGVRE
jgi:nitrate reductase gamma subunit